MIKISSDASISDLGEIPNGRLAKKKKLTKKSKAKKLIDLVQDVTGGNSGGRDSDSSRSNR